MIIEVHFYLGRPDGPGRLPRRMLSAGGPGGWPRRMAQTDLQLTLKRPVFIIPLSTSPLSDHWIIKYLKTYIQISNTLGGGGGGSVGHTTCIRN